MFLHPLIAATAHVPEPNPYRRSRLSERKKEETDGSTLAGYEFRGLPFRHVMACCRGASIAKKNFPGYAEE